MINDTGVGDHGLFTNFLLRFGEVREIIYPDSQLSLSKRTLEYNVAVQHKDFQLNTGYVRTYNNCIVFNLFGGLADKFVYTLRTDPNQKQTKDGLGIGSKVLLLCINGEHAQAVIIGGLRDSKDLEEEGQKAKELGHHLQFLFNGIDYSINKEGELSVTYNGKTKADGKKEDGVADNVIGTKISLLKNGNASITSKNDEEQIVLNHENKQIVLKANQGTQIGQATDFFVKGTTYRNAEVSLHNQLTTIFTQLQAQILAVSISLQTAGAAMVTPVTGAVAAAPAITAAAATLNVASTAFTRIVSALSTFEGQASQYLSTLNKSD